MKRIIQGKNFLRKIAIAILVVLLCYCIVPTYTYAGFGGEILKVFTQLLAALGDVVTGTLNHFMLGTDEMINSVMLDRDNPTVTNPEGALYADPNAEADLILGQDQDVAGNTDDDNEEEIYGGLNIVKVFNAEEKVTKEFEKANHELYKSGWRSQFLSGLMHPIVNFISNVGYVGVAVAGGYLAVNGTITVGNIQSFIQYNKQFTRANKPNSTNICNVTINGSSSRKNIRIFRRTRRNRHT